MSRSCNRPKFFWMRSAIFCNDGARRVGKGALRAVPTNLFSSNVMVGTLRFAHPTGSGVRGWLPPRRGTREHNFDQRARMAAGLDVESRAVGFDQRLGQRQADAGAVGSPIRRRLVAKRLHCGGDFVVVEALAGI